MSARVIRISAALTLFAGMCLSQQAPSFHAQTDLVTVTFKASAGFRTSDLKASNVAA
jgi:hypothetical protein